MASGRTSSVCRDIQTLFRDGTFGGATDQQLLERFKCRSESSDTADTAFAVLVARHGPMVLGVCRRALHDPNDVADAFQATFLVLVRKADSLRIKDSLGSWLYGVCRKVVLRAQADAARRKLREIGLPLEHFVAPIDMVRQEELTALEEEVARLPTPFRLAVLLCDLGGVTHEAAARELCCPVGTIESRLSRGRKRLRERLTKRGLAPTFIAPLLQRLSPPSVPDALSTITVRSGVKYVGSRGAASVSVASLIEGVVAEMAIIKLKFLAFGLVGLTLVGGVGLAVAQQTKERDASPAKITSGTESKKADEIQPPAPIKPGDWLAIGVLEALPGRPLHEGTRRIVRPDGTISLGYYGDLGVARLNRVEIKIKLIEHMKTFLEDETLGLVEQDETGKRRAVAPVESHRVYVDDSINYERKGQSVRLENRNYTRDGAVIKRGDFLDIEVLITLPGRPITGERLVQPDGTVNLGFYGDVEVAGLARREVKAKIVNHLRRWLDDEALGLVVAIKPELNHASTFAKVDPTASDHVFVDESPSYFKKPVNFPSKPGTRIVEPGDRISIEVLEALPGRPISGERLVRPDGSVSLGFYGDTKVAGLTRKEIKVKVVNHLLKFLPESALGLVAVNPVTGVEYKVDPADSTSLYVADDSIYWPNSPQVASAGTTTSSEEQASETQTQRTRLSANGKLSGRRYTPNISSPRGPLPSPSDAHISAPVVRQRGDAVASMVGPNGIPPLPGNARSPFEIEDSERKTQSTAPRPSPVMAPSPRNDPTRMLPPGQEQRADPFDPLAELRAQKKRIDALESKLDRLIKAIESAKGPAQ